MCPFEIYRNNLINDSIFLGCFKELWLWSERIIFRANEKWKENWRYWFIRKRAMKWKKKRINAIWRRLNCVDKFISKARELTRISSAEVKCQFYFFSFFISLLREEVSIQQFGYLVELRWGDILLLFLFLISFYLSLSLSPSLLSKIVKPQTMTIE